MAEIKIIFRGIDAAFKEDPSRAKGVEAIYQFDLDGGEAGVYQLILRGDDSYAAEGEKEKPDCTLKIASEDFAKI